MKTLKENVSYLQGLVEGVNLDLSTDEGRIFKGIISTIESLAEAIDRIETRQSDLEIYLDSLDEELMDLEEDIYRHDDEGFVEMECPECHQVVYFDTSILDSEDDIEVTCPNCDSVVFVNSGDYDFNSDTPEYGKGCERTESDVLQ